MNTGTPHTNHTAAHNSVHNGSNKENEKRKACESGEFRNGEKEACYTPGHAAGDNVRREKSSDGDDGMTMMV